MKVVGPQLTDANSKKYPIAPSTNTTAKIFVQTAAPSGQGEADYDIWFKI